MKSRYWFLDLFWWSLGLLVTIGATTFAPAQDFDEFEGFEELGRFRTVSPGLYGRFLLASNPVGLTNEQRQELKALLNPHLQSGDLLFATPLARQEMFDEVMSHLDESQQVLLRQLVRFECYSRASADRYPEIQRHGELFCWLHPDVAAMINLEDKQLQTVLKASSNWSESHATFKKKHQDFLKELYADWQNELEPILLPRQQVIYKDATGIEFAFGANVRKILKYAYPNSMPLFLANSEGSHSISDSVSPWHLLLTGEQRLDGKMNLHAATKLLQAQEVRTELKLSDSQLDRIKMIETEYTEKHPLPRQLAWGFRERGVPFVPDAVELGIDKSAEGARETGASDEESEKFVDDLRTRLQAVLDPKQQQRWRQIQNHLVLAFGWEEVPLTFPDWPSYLELSSKQAEEFAEVHHRMETRYRNAVLALQAEMQASDVGLKTVAGEVLTAQQKAKLYLIFGNCLRL